MGARNSKWNRAEVISESKTDGEVDLLSCKESLGEVNADLDIEPSPTQKADKDTKSDVEVSNTDPLNDTQQQVQACTSSCNKSSRSSEIQSDLATIPPMDVDLEWDIIEDGHSENHDANDSGDLLLPPLSTPEIQAKNLTTEDIENNNENELNANTDIPCSINNQKKCHDPQHTNTPEVGSLDLHKGSLSMDDINLLNATPAVSVESFISEASADTIESPKSAPDRNASVMRIQTYMKYDERRWLLTVGVKQVECFLKRKYKKRTVFWQVHITLLPQRKQRYKTKYKRTSTPIFNQLFHIDDIAKDSLSQILIRYRLYRCFQKMGRKKFMGEVEVRELSRLLYKQDNIIDGEWHVFKR